MRTPIKRNLLFETPAETDLVSAGGFVFCDLLALGGDGGVDGLGDDDGVEAVDSAGLLEAFGLGRGTAEAVHADGKQGLDRLGIGVDDLADERFFGDICHIWIPPLVIPGGFYYNRRRLYVVKTTFFRRCVWIFGPFPARSCSAGSARRSWARS